MDYIKCPCGSDEFLRVLAIPKGQGMKPVTEERKLVCFKCKDELATSEVNEQLKK